MDDFEKSNEYDWETDCFGSYHVAMEALKARRTAGEAVHLLPFFAPRALPPEPRKP